MTTGPAAPSDDSNNSDSAPQPPDPTAAAAHEPPADWAEAESAAAAGAAREDPFANPAGAGTGGPGVDTTAPEQPHRSTRRLGVLIGVVVVVLGLLGGAAFAVTQWWPSASANPAERLPDSVTSYFEINLDPSFDQTPKLLSLINKFDLDEQFDDFDDVLAELFDDLEADDFFDIEEDLLSWLGRRFAVAEVYGESGLPSYAIAVASTDDAAAEAFFTKVMEEDATIDGVPWAYAVEDGLAVILIELLEEGDPDEFLDDLLAEGRESPLSENSEFTEALDWFRGDQLMIAWTDNATQLEATEALFGDLYGGFNGFDPMMDAFFETYEELYSEFFSNIGDSIVVGVRATGSGLELTYKSFGAEGGSGNATWHQTLAELPEAQVAGLFSLPSNLDELASPVIDLFADTLPAFDDETLPGLDDYWRLEWSYDLALSDEQIDEYDQLYLQWDSGRLTEDDPEFETLLELEELFWLFGTQGEYDDATASGLTEEEWRFGQALTVEEYFDFLWLEEQALYDELAEEDEELYLELDTRLYRHGAVTDYDLFVDEAEPPVDLVAIATDVVELLTGAQFTAAIGNVFEDEPSFAVTVELADRADGKLDELEWCGEFISVVRDEVGDVFDVDGATLAFSDGMAGGDTLGDNERFASAFADAPDAAAVAFFVDIAGILDDAPDADEVAWAQPFQTVSFWHDSSENSGTLRVLID